MRNISTKTKIKGRVVIEKSKNLVKQCKVFLRASCKYDKASGMTHKSKEKIPQELNDTHLHFNSENCFDNLISIDADFYRWMI